MMGVFAEFERAMIVERVRAGMIRAKASGTKSGKAIGRPPTPEGDSRSPSSRHMPLAASVCVGLAEQFGLAHETVRRILCGGD